MFQMIIFPLTDTSLYQQKQHIYTAAADCKKNRFQMQAIAIEFWLFNIFSNASVSFLFRSADFPAFSTR